MVQFSPSGWWRRFGFLNYQIGTLTSPDGVVRLYVRDWSTGFATVAPIRI